MKENKFFLNTALALVMAAALLVCVILRTLSPLFVLPVLNIPNMAALSLIALVLDYYIAPKAKRCWICVPVFAFVTFGLLPWAAAFVTVPEALKLAIVGCVVFTLITWLYSSMLDRISTGPAAKAAPILSAFGLYLAFQCFAGIIL